MSLFDDDEEVKADDLLAGRAAPGHEPLADVLGLLRAMAEEPAPPPSPALASVLRDGLPVAVLDLPAPATGAQSWAVRGMRWAAGLGVAAKVLLGAGVAMAAVAGTATLPMVPDSVQAPVRTALTDLGHRIPGSAGGSVPVPTTTTPEPVVGAVPSGDRPPAEPDHRDGGTDRSKHELVSPSTLGGDSLGGETTGRDGASAGAATEPGEKSPARPDTHPSAPAARPSSEPKGSQDTAPSADPTTPAADPTTPASDRSGAAGQTDQNHD